MPTISIIIPLYNKQDCIQKTLDSILTQPFKDYEIIVVDDGSTDQSVSVVESIKDNNIAIYKKENGGPSSARNYGVKIARGEWILFLDADDKLVPGALDLIASLIKKKKCIDVFTFNQYIERAGKRSIFKQSHTKGYLPFPFINYYLNEIYPGPGRTVVKKNVIESEPYNEDIHRHEDTENTFRLMRKYRFYAIREPLFIYNRETLEASYRRDNIEEDFCCVMRPEGKSLFEQMALYKIFREDTCFTYPELAEELYKGRFDIKRIERWDGILNMWVRIKGYVRNLLFR